MKKLLHCRCNVGSCLSLTGILAHFVGSLGSNFNEIIAIFCDSEVYICFLDYEYWNHSGFSIGNWLTFASLKVLFRSVSQTMASGTTINQYIFHRNELREVQTYTTSSFQQLVRIS